VRRRHFIALGVGGGGLAALAGGLSRHQWHRVDRQSRALGAHVTLVAYHSSRSVAERAIGAAFQALDQLEDVLSLYRPGSQICRLNQDGFLEGPHPDLVRVLGSAVEWAHRTGGAFDPTVQPLWPLYAHGQASEPSALERACRLIDWRKIECGPTQVRLSPGQAITLNGIAQGFAADRVREILVAHGIRHALVDTGEFGALGRKPAGEAWRIGIQHPRVRDAYIGLADLDNRFLATSGDYETAFSDDFSSHHIFDPSTGRSPTALASVTALAPSGLEADALSTAIFVLGPARGLALAASCPGVDVMVVLKSGEILTTPKFPSET
jgi:FAD:protein FMN transferase